MIIWITQMFFQKFLDIYIYISKIRVKDYGSSRNTINIFFWSIEFINLEVTSGSALSVIWVSHITTNLENVELVCVHWLTSQFLQNFGFLGGSTKDVEFFGSFIYIGINLIIIKVQLSNFSFWMCSYMRSCKKKPTKKLLQKFFFHFNREERINVNVYSILG